PNFNTNRAEARSPRMKFIPKQTCRKYSCIKVRLLRMQSAHKIWCKLARTTQINRVRRSPIA
ncbi:MAG: hypothetical protein D8H92_04160, partial [Campylobacter sp.]